MFRNISQNCQEIVTGLACRAISARAETFKFDQFVSKLRVRFLASVFFSFSRILEVFVFEFVF